MSFLKEVFGAKERTLIYNDDSETIGHGEAEIDSCVIMFFDAKEEWPVTPSFCAVYVTDCDTVHAKAIQAGSTEVTPLSTNAWGDRGSRIRDPFGNIWWIQTHVEDVNEEEMMRRLGEQKYLNDMQISTDTLDQAIREISQA